LNEELKVKLFVCSIEIESILREMFVQATKLNK
jgi:hypothetical protein